MLLGNARNEESPGDRSISSRDTVSRKGQNDGWLRFREVCGFGLQRGESQVNLLGRRWMTDRCRSTLRALPAADGFETVRKDNLPDRRQTLRLSRFADGWLPEFGTGVVGTAGKYRTSKCGAIDSYARRLSVCVRTSRRQVVLSLCNSTSLFVLQTPVAEMSSHTTTNHTVLRSFGHCFAERKSFCKPGDTDRASHSLGSTGASQYLPSQFSLLQCLMSLRTDDLVVDAMRVFCDTCQRRATRPDFWSLRFQL